MLKLIQPSWQELWRGHDDALVGAVFTRPEVVEFILDLAGFVASGGRLVERRVLEPACGDGAFVVPLIDRMLAGEKVRGQALDWDDVAFDDFLRAVDLSSQAARRTRERVVVEGLTEAGCPKTRARSLAERWVLHGDALLTPFPHAFDLVVGNPPYVRIEDLPRLVLAEYRDTFATLGDRADLYVAFIERGLHLLAPRGVLAVITANRFTRNLYGRHLRRLIAERFHVRSFVDMEHTQPFARPVSAYPCVVVIDRERGMPTRTITLTSLDEASLVAAERGMRTGSTSEVQEFVDWYPKGEPWVAITRSAHDTLRRLDCWPTLEESAPGTRVGIGVATGADAVFVLPVVDPEIEADRQLPLVMVADVDNDAITWSGHVLINPFNDEEAGGLVDLDRYPGLRRYLQLHRERLAGRHVARQRPDNWYRTIDRVWASFRSRPKLIIPDIQPPDATTIGLDEGRFYPHHNVYTVVSDGWDLRVLKAILRSRMVREQVRAYSVQMRGGGLRWQAQTLRRIRVPAQGLLSKAVATRLARLSDGPDVEAIDDVLDGVLARDT